VIAMLPYRIVYDILPVMPLKPSGLSSVSLPRWSGAPNRGSELRASSNSPSSFNSALKLRMISLNLTVERPRLLRSSAMNVPLLNPTRPGQEARGR
jgi:hypothetical protein